MIILIPLFLLLAAFAFTIMGNIPFAEKLTSWMWISLLFVVVIKIGLYVIENLRLIQIKKFGDKVSQLYRHKKSILALFIFLLLLISGLQRTYYFGGDDTRLFYLYPLDYYTNFISNIVVDNSISNIGNFLPPTSISFFVLLLTFLKYISFGLNLQAMLYLSNILLGLYFFYKLLDYTIKVETPYKKAIFWLSSAMYVFSIFNVYTLFNSRLITVFLVTLFPMFLYLFIRGVTEKKTYFLAIIAILATVLGIVSVSSFWFVASLLVVLPFIFFILFSYWKRALVYIGILGIFLLLLNFHWLFYITHTTLGNTGAATSNSLVSQEFLQKNAEGIVSTTEINSLFYPLLNLYHRQIQTNFNWPYLPIFQSWYMTLLPLNVFFIVIIFFAGFVGKAATKSFKLFTVLSVCFLIALYFFTVNIGNFTFGNIGTGTFVWMTNHLPGFVIFRNMYDKFGHAMAFTFAFIVAVSLSIIASSQLPKKISYILVLFFGFLVVLNSLPFLFGRFNKLPIWTTAHSYQGITDFNDDYKNLTRYIAHQESKGRYLILPLSTGNIIAIGDKSNPTHYYVGVSPLLVLSGKNDYSGALSFGSYQEVVFN